MHADAYTSGHRPDCSKYGGLHGETQHVILLCNNMHI